MKSLPKPATSVVSGNSFEIIKTSSIPMENTKSLPPPFGGGQCECHFKWRKQMDLN